MESWQVIHVQRNLLDLLRFTNCDILFISCLHQEGVLSEFDISKLEARGISDGRIAKSSLLYNILITRRGAFNLLIEALRETAQTESLGILEPALAAGKSVYIKLQQITDTTATWNDLSDSLKAELRSKLVQFQGKTVTLGQLAKYHDLSNVDGRDLFTLAKTNVPTVVNNQIPDHLQYYVHRTIETRKKLKPEVFKHDCNDLFVVQGVKRYELTGLAGSNGTDVSGDQLQWLTVRFILLEYEPDFERICKLARAREQPVHWIKYQADQSSYEWVKSSGSVQTLQNYADTSQVQFGEEELGLMEHKINVISDSPGMGKTKLLISIAHTILTRDDDPKLIRFIELKEMVQSLENQEINLDNIVSILAEQFSEFKLGKDLVKNFITSSPCVLMFDGFDKVLSHQIIIAKDILMKVATLEYAQIFVTTRPHMREELENSLQVLGYTILPFDDANQLSFILGYWDTLGIERNESVVQFAKSCLKSLNFELNDFENQIAGIPLQCKMLAEVYTEDAKQCSSENRQQSITMLTSVFEMYERHIQTRFEGISTKGCCLQCFKRAHTYLALKLLFPEHEDEFYVLNDESISQSEMCELGIVEGTHSNGVRFVHRTFAEYLVAWCFMEKLGGGPKRLFQEILSTIPKEEAFQTPVGSFNPIESFQFKFPVVCYFINEFIKRLHQQDFEGLINNLTSPSLQVAPIIFASAHHNYVYVLKALSTFLGATTNQRQQEDHPQHIGMSDLLLIAAKDGDVELWKIFCEKFDITQIQFKTSKHLPHFKITPLHIAIQRGHYNLVKYLIQQYNNELLQLPYLLHFCVERSLGDNKATLNSKIQIIKLLCEKSKQWLDEPLPDGTKPLAQGESDIGLLNCLMEEGASLEPANISCTEHN